MVAQRGPAGIGVGTDLELRETAYITDDDGIVGARRSRSEICSNG